MAKPKPPAVSSAQGESPPKAQPPVHRTRSVTNSRRNQNGSQHGTQVLEHRPGTTTGTTTTNSSQSIVTAHQSMEIVQTLLHGCVSSLAFMRMMFHEGCYDRRYYAGTDSHWAYHDYASGKQEVDPSATADPAQQTISDIKKGVPALKRGVSSRVDQLLDVLETGVFDALQRSYLHSLHLAIIEDPDRREDVLELYTFTFQYTGTTADINSQVVSSIEVTEHRGNKVTLKQARSSLKHFVLKMIELCYNLPALPDLRFLTLDITYTGDTPPEYRAPGFGRPATNAAKFPNDGWQKSTIPVSKLNVGFHSVALKASYLEPNPSDSINQSDCDDDNVNIPKGLHYGHLTEKTDDIENYFEVPSADTPKAVKPITQDEGGRKGEEPPPQMQVDTEGSPSFSPGPDPMEVDLNHQASLDLPSRHSSSVIHGQSITSLPPQVAIEATLEGRTLTPSPEDLRDKVQLERMLQGSISQNVDLEPTQVQNSLEPSQDFVGSKLQISQVTLQQLRWQRSNQLPPQKGYSVTQKRSGSVDTASGGDVVSCQCGHGADEGEMVHCDFCYTWQHLHCYGYLEQDHGRVPDDYACYKCLLPSEPEVMKKVRDLAVYRRVLFTIQGKDFDNEKQFAKALGWEYQDVVRMVKKLRSDNLLASIPGPKKGPNKHRIVLNRSEETRRHIKDVYFDPTTSIAHHLELPMSLEEHLRNASMSGTLDTDMPRKRRRDPAEGNEIVPVAKKAWGWSTTVAINVQEGYSPSTKR